ELSLGELDQTVEVTRVALLQEVVREHRDERGRERDGAAIRDTVGDEALEHLDEGQVGPGDALVEPLLLHHRGVLGMADERQVSMQHEGEVAERHRITVAWPATLPWSCCYPRGSRASHRGGARWHRGTAARSRPGRAVRSPRRSAARSRHRRAIRW